MIASNSKYSKETMDQLLTLVADYIQTENDGLQSPVRQFPKSDEIFKGKLLNLELVAKSIAEYEYEHVQVGNKLTEVMTKKTQIRMFQWESERLLGVMQVQSFSKDANFCIARLQDIENVLRSKAEIIDKCITALRSLQSNAPR